MAQQKRIRLGTMRLQVRSLASLSGLRIWHCRELWCRPAAVAPTGPLAWETPCAMDAALKKKKKKRQKTGRDGGDVGPVNGMLNSNPYLFTATFRLLSGRFSLKNTFPIKMA